MRRKATKRHAACRNPRCKANWKSGLTIHHIVPKRDDVVKDKPGLRDHLDNGMPLCETCHVDFERGRLTIPRQWLTVKELAFVIKHKGKKWLNETYPKEGVDG